MDNVLSNDVLARTLEGLLMQRYGIHFSPENGQIRCLAHVVNLVVQKVLSSVLDADDPDINDYYLANKFLPFHYDLGSDEDLQVLESEETVKADFGEAKEHPNEDAGDVIPSGLTPVQKVSPL